MSVNTNASGELSAIEAVLTERVDVLEERADGMEKTLEARRVSSEGLRKEQNEVFILLGKIEVRLQHLEENSKDASARRWGALGSTVNLIVGALLAIIASYFMKH